MGDTLAKGLSHSGQKEVRNLCCSSQCKKNQKSLATTQLYVLGPCWPEAGLMVSLGPATFCWVLLSEKPTQIWPRYYTAVEKHEQNKRGRGKGKIVMQRDGSHMRCWREARSGWVTHVNEALHQQLCAPQLLLP